MSQALTLGEHPVNDQHLALNDNLISKYIIMLTDPNKFSLTRMF